jgi:IS30 family transposase
VFSNRQEIESALDCQMHFADPYCAWQKGTNENLNGLLREFYPKGHNLSRVSPKTLKKNLALINARPKKY